MNPVNLPVPKSRAFSQMMTGCLHLFAAAKLCAYLGLSLIGPALDQKA